MDPDVNGGAFDGVRIRLNTAEPALAIFCLFYKLMMRSSRPRDPNDPRQIKAATATARTDDASMPAVEAS
jgi:hypothetical protein